jgi:uncharacterized membrane protein YkoI
MMISGTTPILSRESFNPTLFLHTCYDNTNLKEQVMMHPINAQDLCNNYFDVLMSSSLRSQQNLRLWGYPMCVRKKLLEGFKMEKKKISKILTFVVIGGLLATASVTAVSAASSGTKQVNPIHQNGDGDKEIADDQKGKEEQDQETNDDLSQAQLEKQATVTKEQATAAALLKQPGTVTGIELEDEDGQAVYAVDITDSNGKALEVKVDAKSGTVTKVETADDENGKEEQDNEEQDSNELSQAQLEKQATVTKEQATAAALLKQPGTVKAIELEDEDGQAVYAVDVTDSNGKAFEVKVDAKSGTVTKVETADDNK